MSCYIRIVGKFSRDQFWEITENEAIKLSGGNARGEIRSHYVAKEGESVWDTLARETGWFDGNCPNTPPLHLLDLPSKTFYNRIARPSSYSNQEYSFNPGAYTDRHSIVLGLGQLRALVLRLENICQTVHPSTENLNVYGHEIRNLIILSATEVETHWRGVLKANGIEGRLTTNHYARLLHPMRLAEYSIEFIEYPWLGPFSPFASWDIDAPTKSLPWYDAYNHIKHDREENFHHAKLLHAFNAVIACIVMQVSQFSQGPGLGGSSDLKSKIKFKSVPHWKPNEVYCSPAKSGEFWKAVPHPDFADS